jgi:uncharacterized protein (AIM24 family)
VIPPLYILENNQQTGPFQEAQILGLIQQGRVNAQTLCWGEGMAAWGPIGQTFPALFAGAPASTPVAAPPSMGGSTVFEVIKADLWRVPKITLQNEEVVLEAGALRYMKGNIEIEAQLPSVGGFLKSALTKESTVKPRYRGTGEIFLEPTFGDVNLLELSGDAWVLDKGAFLACDRTVEVGMFTNKTMAGLFGGEGFFQTEVKGRGKVFYVSPGPVQKIVMDGSETLTVDGSFAVARTASLQFEVAKATKGMFSSWTSGEGIVNKFRGQGIVMIAPVPNRYLTLVQQFGGLHSAISRISRS